MRIFQFGEVPSTYQDDFTRHVLPEKMTRNKRTIIRLKEFSRRRATAVEPPKPELFWTTPSYGRIRDVNKPDFKAYIKEPKEIIGHLPKPNLEIPKGDIEEMAKRHEEVIKTRPRVICVPNQMAADDGNEEQRRMHAYHVYYRESLPGHTKGDSVYHPNLEINIPKESFKMKEFATPSEIYPPVKPKLKKCFARLDADKERWLEFSDPNYNRKEIRIHEENEPKLDENWVKTLEELHNTVMSQKKYRNYSLGYTGHIASKSLPVRKDRHMTLDPMLSFYEAVDSRRDNLVLHSEPDIKQKYADMPLNKLRVVYGVNYIPTGAYYNKDINNVPFKEFRKKNFFCEKYT